MNKKILMFSIFNLLSVLTSCNLSVNSEEVNKKNIDKRNDVEGFFLLNDYVYVNYLPGYYSDTIQLEIKPITDDYDIYYTIDGSSPNINDSNLYTTPIKLEKLVSNDIDDYPLTSSVDGILEGDTEGKCVSNIYNERIQLTGDYPLYERQNIISISVVDKNNNEIISNRSLTYLISDHKYTIPVISLTMPYEDWFDEKTGMYNNIREEIEKRVYLEYFDFSNNYSFSLNSKIKLGGNWTLGYPMRTLNLNFNKDENGKKNTPIDIPIFGDRSTRGNSEEKLSGLTRFRLHSGGNAFESHLGFNDALIQNMMAESNASTTGYRPCITYLNGEYWGLYYIREHYSDTYFADNYGIDKDDVIFYELKGDFIYDDGDEDAGEVAINELLDYINNNNFNSYEVYQQFINEYIDENSFIDMLIAELYSSNWDFIGNNNNLKMWRTSKIDKEKDYYDGKWRFCLHDLDFAFTEYTNFLDKNVNYSYTYFKMFNNLLKQKEFRTKFYNRAVYLLRNNFEPAKASRILNQMVEDIFSYKKDAMIRWGKKEEDFDIWLNDINSTYNYFENKNRTFLAVIQDSLNQYN